MPENKAPSVMGFAQYSKKEECQPELLIEACQKWQIDFLTKQPGIQKHMFLGNLSGEFADIIFAQDAKSFAAMSENMQNSQSSKDFLNLLQMKTIQLTQNSILKPNFKIPENFSCVEFGTFQPDKNRKFTEQKLLHISANIEDDYLSKHPATKEHFMGKIGEDTYSEVTFYSTLAEARRICSGYIGSPACEELLNLIKPDTEAMDFWFVLA